MNSANGCRREGIRDFLTRPRNLAPFLVGCIASTSSDPRVATSGAVNKLHFYSLLLFCLVLNVCAPLGKDCVRRKKADACVVVGVGAVAAVILLLCATTSAPHNCRNLRSSSALSVRIVATLREQHTTAT